jgi:hypothetical protein
MLGGLGKLIGTLAQLAESGGRSRRIAKLFAPGANRFA